VQSSGAIDGDADGSGEYGYFGELAGTALLRDSAAGASVIGANFLVPAVMSSSFGTMSQTAVTDGTVVRSGYCFKMFLPDSVGAGNAGLAEAPLVGGNGGTLPDADNAEILWNCYAWPVSVNQTGNRAFFMNQEGDLLQTQNRVAPFTTTTGGPVFNECYDNTVIPGMAAPLLIGAAGISGNIWTPVQ
jgi:hypothetical protein